MTESEWYHVYCIDPESYRLLDPNKFGGVYWKLYESLEGRKARLILPRASSPIEMLEMIAFGRSTNFIERFARSRLVGKLTDLGCNPSDIGALVQNGERNIIFQPSSGGIEAHIQVLAPSIWEARSYIIPNRDHLTLCFGLSFTYPAFEWKVEPCESQGGKY
ncbi:MAG: hypothetical protein ABIG95_00865 [Candidatus Woesearchaeota archaeon]